MTIPQGGAELQARLTAASAVLGDYQRNAPTADTAERAMWAARLADMLGYLLAVPSASTVATIAPAAQLGDVLVAVREAIDIPLPATVGDGEVYDRILLERLTHVRLAVTSVLDDPRADPEFHAGYLRERLAEVPATGYTTWAEAVAARKAAEGDDR